MGAISFFIDVILHLDVYLGTFIQEYGLLVYGLLFLVVFLETGLVFTPFLPGDSLLFAAGTFAALGTLNVSIVFVIITVAAVLGDTVNYWVGRYVGVKLFEHESRFLKKKHLEKTQRFYAKYGAKTIVLARFVPIVRTFAPFVAGIGKMDYPLFLLYNICGGICWVALFVFGGYFFGNIPIVRENFTFTILLIIILSFVPVFVEYVKQRKIRKQVNSDD